MLINYSFVLVVGCRVLLGLSGAVQSRSSRTRLAARSVLAHGSNLAKRQFSSTSSSIRSPGSSFPASSYLTGPNEAPDPSSNPFYTLYFAIGSAHSQHTAQNGTSFDNCGLWVVTNKTANMGAFFRPDPRTGRWAFYDIVSIPTGHGNEAGEINPSRWDASVPDSAQVVAAQQRVSTWREYTAPWCRHQARALRHEWRRRSVVRLTASQKEAAASGAIFGAVPGFGTLGGAGFGCGVGLCSLAAAGSERRDARLRRQREHAIQMAHVEPIRAGRGAQRTSQGVQNLHAQVVAGAEARDRRAQEEARARVQSGSLLQGGGRHGTPMVVDELQRARVEQLQRGSATYRAVFE